MTKRKSRFFLGMILYAAVFLAFAAIGIAVFWQYMEAYELSRPLTAINSYLAELDMQYIRKETQDFLDTLDGNVQSSDQSFAVIEEKLDKKITAAKNSKQSTQDKMVYALRCGSTAIGSVTIVPGSEEKFGFTSWVVHEDSFDFSWLVSEDISVTVPSGYVVSLNGQILDESYITQTDILYPVLEDFSGEFEMPTLMTYTAGNFLGELCFDICDSAGNPVEISSDTDLDQLLPQCSEQEYEQLKKLVLDYLNRYIVYSSSANHDAPNNYGWLNQMLIPGSELSIRLASALDGLQYVQNIRDKIISTEINGIYKVSEERYLCDISYVLEVLGRKGVVELEHNMKVVFLQTRYGLRVEAMTQY